MDANTSCWVDKASKIHEVLEINIVKSESERETAHGDVAKVDI